MLFICVSFGLGKLIFMGHMEEVFNRDAWEMCGCLVINVIISVEFKMNLEVTLHELDAIWQ